MPRPRDLQPFAPAERAALRRARRVSMRGTVALAAALALTVAALAGTVSGRDPIGVLPLVALLGLGWAWLLRRMPAGWIAASRDLRGGQATVVTGTAGLRQRRGIGLFAPVHTELLLDGGRYRLASDQAREVRESMPVVARVAPASAVLLSIRPGVAANGRSGATAVDHASATIHGLSPREADLLRLIADGHTDKAIARQLGLEPATVRTYNSQLYAKLGVRRRTEAVARARAMGLVTEVDD